MKNFPIAIFALTLGAFSIGMTEFVIMGLLPNVANDLHVSISASGQLITGYALGIAVGGPILTLSTGKMSRKRLLILLMILFVAGNAVAAVSSSYGLLMAARILTSCAIWHLYRKSIRLAHVISRHCRHWSHFLNRYYQFSTKSIERRSIRYSK